MRFEQFSAPQEEAPEVEHAPSLDEFRGRIHLTPAEMIRLMEEGGFAPEKIEEAKKNFEEAAQRRAAPKEEVPVVEKLEERESVQLEIPAETEMRYWIEHPEPFTREEMAKLIKGLASLRKEHNRSASTQVFSRAELDKKIETGEQARYFGELMDEGERDKAA